MRIVFMAALAAVGVWAVDHAEAADRRPVMQRPAQGDAAARPASPANSRPTVQRVAPPVAQPSFERGARRFVADAHWRYRQSQERVGYGRVVLPLKATTPAVDRNQRSGQRRPRGTRSASRAPRRTAMEERTGSAGSFRLSPRTPEVGTPEWTREQEHSKRREAELTRRMRAICGNC